MRAGVALSGCAFSPTVTNTLQGGEDCYPSDEVFLLAVVPGVLEGRVALQGCIGTLGELGAFGLIGVVGALVPVQVPEHEEEEADQDQSHCSDHSCKKDRMQVSQGRRGQCCSMTLSSGHNVLPSWSRVHLGKAG